MTPTATIRRFHAVYRLPANRTEEKRRLDGVLREAVDRTLEAALDRAGLLDGRLICIRRVHVPVRLRLSSTDSALAAAWSAQAVETILRLAQEAFRNPENEPADFEMVVVYSSRLRALFDMARRGVRSDFRRVWVWRRLGLWSPGAAETIPQAAIETAGAALHEPELILPMLVLLARAGALPAFAANLESRQWQLLAAAVFNRAGVSRAVIESVPEVQMESAEAERIADRALAASPLFAVFRELDAPMPTVEALSAIILAQSEPSALLLPPTRLGGALAAIAGRLSTILAAHQEAIRKPQRRMAAKTIPDAPKAPPALETQPAESPRADPESAPYTEYGGLLFLVALVDKLGLPAEMLEGLPARSLRWTLHQLATSLLPIGPDDPAALAFCGLEPDADPPDRGEPPATAEELDRLAGWRARLTEALAARLAQEGRSTAQLLHFVCRRPATVWADPGWIELRFPLQTVSTEIRRAALDLDPGWVPWLGVVLRFIYE